MSKIEISFNITNYKPNYFNFDDYYFEFVCDETKFKDIIEYSKKNIITNKTEIKSNLKYFVKVFDKKELIGLTNFIIPQKYLFKNKKTFSINFNNLKLTMSDFHLKKLFPNNNNNNNNNIQLGISIDIKITFKFFQKKINFSYKKIPFKTNNKKNFLYNYNNIYNNTNNNNIDFKTHRETSLNSTINTNRSAKTPIYMRKKLNNMNFSENKNNFNNKNNENDDEDDLTVIDSVLIDNEYTYENDNESNDLKKKLNFNNVNNNNNIEIPNDNDLVNLIEKSKEKFFENLIEKNKELNNVCERHCKLIQSLNNYQNKLKEIKIKKIKIQNKINTNNINNIIADFNKNQNDFINKQLDINEKENKIFDELYFYLEDNINNNYYNNFTNNNNNNHLNKKELLIKSIKNIMDLDVDLDKCFEPEDIKKFQNICEKYGIIESLNNNY